MLRRIYVKNLALIDEVEVAFGPRLNTMTGETGAGKSIIIGAVSMAVGGRVSKEMIRQGSDYALAELEFEVTHPQILEKLEAMDLPMEGPVVTISRRISPGRSVARINGEVVSLQVLKAAASLLIDIHGQHEHQSLLNPASYIELTDRFGKDSLAAAREEVAACYRIYRDLKKEMDEAITDDGKRLSEISFLEFQVSEIEDAALAEGEEARLERDYRKMSHARQMMESVARAHELTGYEGGSSAGEQVGRALRELQSIEGYDEEAVGSLVSMLMDIDGLLNDFNRELADYESGLVFDEGTYRDMEARLELIGRLKAKYGGSVSEILSFRDRCQEELEKLKDYETYLSGLRQHFAKAEKDLAQASDRLTALRKAQAAILQEKITGALVDLNFIDVRFAIHVLPLGAFSEKGQDKIELKISTNPGEDLKDLSKVASGGELSRIMLAIKSVLADTDEIETLIFDEIDTGISGRTAQKVSEKMDVIAGRHQVLCITHLPQIAAMADTHFLIEKHTEGERTKTQIHELSEEEAVDEIARLLGGVRITEAVRQNAREMKQLARGCK